MELKQYTLPGLVEAGNISVSDKVFGVEYNEGLVWQVVKSFLAGARSGSKSNLSRSDVRGGGIKPWRQKGLGKARAGSNCSPLWRTGGVTFAAKPRDHRVKVNKKMYRAAMRSLFSLLVSKNILHVVKDLSVSDHKTKTALTLLGSISDKPLLVVVKELDDNLRLAARNLPKVKCLAIKNVSPLDLSKAHFVVMTSDVASFCEEWLV